MKLAMWGATDVGRARKINEDSFLLAPDHGLLAVADGMGGYQRGDVAAELACNVIKEMITTHRHVIDLYRRSSSEAARSAVQTMLDSAMQKACKEVHEAALAITGKGGRMGTTMDILLQVGSTAFIAHVGDGRIFLLRGGEVHQLTADHTLLQRQLDAGQELDDSLLTTSQHIMTRALGVFSSVQVDALSFALDVGDRFVICTDGLYRYLEEEEYLTEAVGGSVAQVVDRLAQIASSRGGRDNLTVVVCDVEAENTADTEQATLRRMEILRNVGLFQYCTYRELMRVCQAAEHISVPAGTVLFEEGAQGRECYIIEEGQISIRRNTQELAMLGAGDYFGEMSFIDVPRRSASAEVIIDSKLLVIRRNQFLQLLKQDSELAAKLMWQLLQKLSRLVRDSNRQASIEVASKEFDGGGQMSGDTILEEG